MPLTVTSSRYSVSGLQLSLSSKRDKLTNLLENKPRLHSQPSKQSLVASDHYYSYPDAASSPSNASSDLSDPATVIRWSTPPLIPETPQMEPRRVSFNEKQVRAMEAAATTRRDTQIERFDSGPPTPSVDDTPYIRFAIDQLTRDEEIKAAQRALERQQQRESGTSGESYPVERVVPDEGLGYLRSVRNERNERNERLLSNQRTRSSRSAPIVPTRLMKPNFTTISLHSDTFLPVEPYFDTPRHSELEFLPTILRPVSMITLALLCILMITALIFCAVYSLRYSGLVAFEGGLYGPGYFVFGFLPQILAAIIMVYVHMLMTAVRRMVPFVNMAGKSDRRRSKAMFLRIFPSDFLRPDLDYFKSGNGLIGTCHVSFWLLLLTIPLQSSLFSVRNPGSGWRWSTVQGVAWTLVVIYILVLFAVVALLLWFRRKTTGLTWDPRSLADIVSILPRSNLLHEFSGSEIAGDPQDFKDLLSLQAARLGYWKTPKAPQGVFYCLGGEGNLGRKFTGGGKFHEKDQVPAQRSGKQRVSDPESISHRSLLSTEHQNNPAALLYSAFIRFRYLPWYLRTPSVIVWCVVAFALLLAFIVVSFVPATTIHHGFKPRVPVAPTDAAFSPANFLYSFVPSLLGLLMYLLFQPIDHSFRQLQPWAELAKPEGATASDSLLLDYTASSTVACVFQAIQHKHYRVAVLATCSFLYILLPILAGGLFFPLVAFPSGTPLMFTNLPAFYVSIVLCIIYFLSLLVIIPQREMMGMPHRTDTLAEITSYFYASPILEDAAFRAPRSKADLVSRLAGTREHDQPVRYAMGVFKGSVEGKEHLGVERVMRKGEIALLVLKPGIRE